MPNYKMTISYDGSRYYGWEHQPGTDLTIQGKLEAVFSGVLGQPVSIPGAGRTDAGVHAKGMCAHARFETEMDDETLRRTVNSFLPEDICVLTLHQAADRFHSRYNAAGKTYRYTCYVGEDKPVFDRKYVYTLEKVPDIERMRRAAADLMGQHDFASFCGNPKMKKSTVRIVDKIDIRRKGDYLTITYHGTGFLQYMVRILTGTLLEVGFGKRSPESMPELLEARDRSHAGFTVPAKGLCLIEVDY